MEVTTQVFQIALGRDENILKYFRWLVMAAKLCEYTEKPVNCTILNG